VKVVEEAMIVLVMRKGAIATRHGLYLYIYSKKRSKYTVLV